MKKKHIKRIVSGLWALAMVAMSGMSALAADTVDVNGSGRTAAGTSVVVGYQDKDLFSNMQDLVPGDTIDNQVTLSNKSSRAVSIYLRAYPDFTSTDGITAVRGDSTAEADGHTFRDDILNQIEMTLTLDGRIIYEGSADGFTPKAGYEAMTAGNYGLNLGSFAAGAQKNLSITLNLPGPELDNQFANKFDAVDWVFRAEGTTPGGNNGGGGGGGGGGSSNWRPPTNIADSQEPLGPWTGVDDGTNVVITDPSVPLSSLPRTGDSGISGYVFSMLLALLVACSVIYLRKRYNRT